jgi:hypothetical protein
VRERACRVIAAFWTTNKTQHAHAHSCRHLHTLSLTGLPRLKDKALTPLPGRGLSSVLRRLDLSGCSGLTNKALPAIAQLTGLHALVLTGWSGWGASGPHTTVRCHHRHHAQLTPSFNVHATTQQQHQAHPCGRRCWEP